MEIDLLLMQPETVTKTHFVKVSLYNLISLKIISQKIRNLKRKIITELFMVVTHIT